MESFYNKEFYNRIKEFILSADNILILSHLDADGLCSAGLISRLLLSWDKNFTVRIIKQLEDESVFENLVYDLIIITDMGSGQFRLIEPFLEKKKFIIIDHHQVQNEFEDNNLIHFNPGLHDDSYSASSLTYLVVRTLNSELDDLLPVGLVGASGDMQASPEFTGFNKELVDYGVKKEYLTISKGLSVYGRVSKPLHEALSQSFELFIPGVTGNESSSIEFLSELNIDLKSESGDWKTLNTLTDAERKKLVSNIIIRRVNNGLDSNVLSEIITVEGNNGALSNLKEWSVLLNACGRQGAYSLGVLLCMGFYDYALPLIDDVMKEYKILLSKALNLVKNDSSLLNVSDDLLVIKAGSKVKDTIIGTIGGILLKEPGVKASTFIGFADRKDGVKVSCRTKKDVNLGNIIKKVCTVLNCTGGGHSFAGGALIKKSDEEEFLKLFKKELGKHL